MPVQTSCVAPVPLLLQSPVSLSLEVDIQHVHKEPCPLCSRMWLVPVVALQQNLRCCAGWRASISASLTLAPCAANTSKQATQQVHAFSEANFIKVSNVPSWRKCGCRRHLLLNPTRLRWSAGADLPRLASGCSCAHFNEATSAFVTSFRSRLAAPRLCKGVLLRWANSALLAAAALCLDGAAC